MMRFIFYVGLLTIVASCSQRIELLQGKWLGVYDGQKVELEFKGDSLSILYSSPERTISKKIELIEDVLIIGPDVVDTCRIVKLDKENLVMRPNKKVQADVNILFLIDFKKFE